MTLKTVYSINNFRKSQDIVGEIVDYMRVLEQLKFSAVMVYYPCAGSAWISVDGKVIEINGGALVHLL